MRHELVTFPLLLEKLMAAVKYMTLVTERKRNLLVSVDPIHGLLGSGEKGMVAGKQKGRKGRSQVMPQ